MRKIFIVCMYVCMYVCFSNATYAFKYGHCTCESGKYVCDGQILTYSSCTTPECQCVNGYEVCGRRHEFKEILCGEGGGSIVLPPSPM